MIELRIGDPQIIEWLRSRLNRYAPNGWNPALVLPVAVMDGDRLLAGLVYHDWHRGRDIQVSMAAASPRWAQRHIIRQLIQIPFIHGQCERFTASTGADNLRMQRFLEGIGFQREGVIRRGYGTEDMLIYGMLRHEAEARGWLSHTSKDTVAA